MWAAEKLGITGRDAEAYSDALAVGTLDPERSDVLSKIRKDFDAGTEGTGPSAHRSACEARAAPGYAWGGAAQSQGASVRVKRDHRHLDIPDGQGRAAGIAAMVVKRVMGQSRTV
jgi:hypothetical protein